MEVTVEQSYPRATSIKEELAKPWHIDLCPELCKLLQKISSIRKTVDNYQVHKQKGYGFFLC
jgi:hypothetical protein